MGLPFPFFFLNMFLACKTKMMFASINRCSGARSSSLHS